MDRVTTCREDYARWMYIKRQDTTVEVGMAFYIDVDVYMKMGLAWSRDEIDPILPATTLVTYR